MKTDIYFDHTSFSSS